MKQSTVISYVTLTFTVLFVTFLGDALAEQEDESTRQCLIEVREVMASEGVKLGAGDLKRVTGDCKRGDVNRATEYVMWIGAYMRCTRDLKAHIENNKLDVDKDLLSRARGRCRLRDAALEKAIEVVDGAPTIKTAEPAEIISFVASNSKIYKGGAVTLSWRTANANTVTLSKLGGKDSQRVQTSGSQSVSPDKTTTYLLMAGQQTKGWTAMEEKLLKVTVLPKGVGVRKCSITGKLTGKWRQWVQNQHVDQQGSMWTVDVAIFSAGSGKWVGPASVENKGRYGTYRFKGLTPGEKYTIKPSWDSNPSQRTVSCSTGKSHRKPSYNFHITGHPMYD